MAKEIDINIIKTTQLSLGKYVKRPPLTEKLLKKPPFRFLHDIITSVVKSTRVFDGLFEEYELVSENVKDRDAKINFLHKIICVLSETTGKNLQVKPSKIVAGQEPEKTNELLQCLADVLDKNLSTGEAIKKIKESRNKNKTESKEAKLATPPKNKEKPIKSNAGNPSSTKIKLKENTKQKNSSTLKNVLNQNTPKAKQNSRKKENKEPLSGNSTVSVNEDDDKSYDLNYSIDHVSNSNNGTEKEHLQTSQNNEPMQSLDDKNNEQILDNNTKDDEINEDSRKLTSFSNHQASKESSILELNQEQSDTITVSENSAKNLKLSNQPFGNISEKHSNVLLTKHSNETVSSATTHESGEKSAIRPSSVRPSSSRPGAPKIRDKQENTSPTEILLGKVNIISDSAVIEEDEDTVKLVDSNIVDVDVSQSHEDESFAEQKSHLVQQILDSQRRFNQGNGKTEIEWHIGSQKPNDDETKELEQLRFNIQSLSRVSNPLGKLLDHVQEDVEVMRQELQQWIKMYEDTSTELSKQKSLNEHLMQPLNTKIKQIDADILEKRQKINDLKITVHRNATRIEKLLENGEVQYK